MLFHWAARNTFYILVWPGCPEKSQPKIIWCFSPFWKKENSNETFRVRRCKRVVPLVVSWAWESICVSESQSRMFNRIASHQETIYTNASITLIFTSKFSSTAAASGHFESWTIDENRVEFSLVTSIFKTRVSADMFKFASEVIPPEKSSSQGLSTSELSKRFIAFCEHRLKMLKDLESKTLKYVFSTAGIIMT